MNKWIIIIVFSIVAIFVLGWVLSNNPKIVGKTIKESDFKEFYYTYSSTTNPPEFQRYRIYIENGKRMFYHEKREGDNVFLTEEDITVSGKTELTSKEWEEFWNCIVGGTVENRQEDTSSGGSGPWLYLYWNGDKDKCQQFTFADLEKKVKFEEFCVGLVNR